MLIDEQLTSRTLSRLIVDTFKKFMAIPQCLKKIDDVVRNSKFPSELYTSGGVSCSETSTPGCNSCEGAFYGRDRWRRLIDTADTVEERYASLSCPRGMNDIRLSCICAPRGKDRERSS